jgi:DNA (cytosine-5)-methyltransferase 1|nr:MAG TPA: Cytosine specific methyltransferase [Caudoviricetes sp.]
MKFIDWFAGIGGFRRGMELAGHECVGFCEFDKFATASYISMHLLTDEQRKRLDELPQKKRQKEILKDEYRNGEWYANDVRRVCADDIPKADCWCFGFPCQDISVAGKQLGFQGNRSSLFFRVMYLIGQLKEEDKPTYLFIENVKNLLSVNGGWDFARLLIEMEQCGYDAEWQVLNSKDFGVPQNRERCFIIGHLRGRGSAKVFPVERADGENSVSLNLFGCLNGRNSQRDRVYSSEGLAPTISTKPGGNKEPKVPIIFDTSYIGQDGKAREYEGICPTLTSRDYKEPRSVGVVCNVNPSGKGMNGNVYDSNGVSPSLTTNKGEGNKIAIPVLTPDRAEKRQNGRRFKDDGEQMFTLTSQDRHGVAVEVKEATKQGYAECRVGIDSMNFSMPNSKTRRGRVGQEIANTLDASCNQGIFVQVSEELVVYAIWYEKYQCYIAIRKLTPKECFRLQGWTDDYFEKAQFVNSDSQLYKQAGNGVTVNVIEEIAEKLRSA